MADIIDTLRAMPPLTGVFRALVHEPAIVLTVRQRDAICDEVDRLRAEVAELADGVRRLIAQMLPHLTPEGAAAVEEMLRETYGALGEGS